MNRRRVGWFAALAMLTLLAAASAPAFPMTESDPAMPSEDKGEQAKGDATVEQILQQQEELLRGQRFSYDPGNRRDPFHSLIEPPSDGPRKRPRGVAGMLVSEIDLVGIVQDETGGDVAFFTGSDNKGYFLRVGERVYDATLIAIDARRGAVTFRQQVDDPRLIKPYRDVVRTLVPLDEESTR